MASIRHSSLLNGREDAIGRRSGVRTRWLSIQIKQILIHLGTSLASKCRTLENWVSLNLSSRSFACSNQDKKGTHKQWHRWWVETSTARFIWAAKKTLPHIMGCKSFTSFFKLNSWSPNQNGGLYPSWVTHFLHLLCSHLIRSWFRILRSCRVFRKPRQICRPREAKKRKWTGKNDDRHQPPFWSQIRQQTVAIGKLCAMINKWKKEGREGEHTHLHTH